MKTAEEFIEELEEYLRECVDTNRELIGALQTGKYIQAGRTLLKIMEFQAQQ